MGMVDDISSILRLGINRANDVMRYGPNVTGPLKSVIPNNKSIVRGAKDATFQFPCLISDTVPIDLANTLARTLDRVYADLTQTWISMHPIMDMSLDPTPMSYLKRLHQNIRLESVEESSDNGELYEKSITEAYSGEALLYVSKDKNYGILISGSGASKEMLESHKNYLDEYMSDYDMTPITEADTDGTTAYDLANSIMDSKLRQVKKDERITTMTQTSKREAPKLLDRDVKKSNDLTPYGIQVRLIAKNEKNEFFQYIDFIVGVKAILHPIKSEEIISNIQRTLQNKSAIFKFLRWTTGEISLIKNIILNLDELKMDASSKNRWFPTLRRLKKRKFGLHDITVPHAVIPNATMVISSYEADYLLNNLAIDVQNTNVAKKILNNLFLVAFVIIDESRETVSILYDGDSDFQVYALETLERENAMSSNKLGREIGRMISH
jgi:hypothetical protein